MLRFHPYCIAPVLHPGHSKPRRASAELRRGAELAGVRPPVVTTGK